MEKGTYSIAETIAAFKIIGKILLNPDGSEREIPFNVKYKLQRCKDVFEKDFKFFEAERISLIKKLGKQEGDQMVVPADKMKDFSAELMKILKIKVEHSIKKLTPEEVEVIDIKDATIEEVDIFTALLVDDKELTEDMNKPIVKE